MIFYISDKWEYEKTYSLKMLIYLIKARSISNGV